MSTKCAQGSSTAGGARGRNLGHHDDEEVLLLDAALGDDLLILEDLSRMDDFLEGRLKVGVGGLNHCLDLLHLRPPKQLHHKCNV